MCFNEIANEIINHPKYKQMQNELHHGLTRYDHSMRVAEATYKITKKLGFDYISATRAALLHDFYIDEDFVDESSPSKLRKHPYLALENAKKYFKINPKEANAIKTHMFPITLKIPTSKEGLILNLADTTVAIYECSKYKITTALGVWILFIFNFITFNNK